MRSFLVCLLVATLPACGLLLDPSVPGAGPGSDAEPPPRDSAMDVLRDTSPPDTGLVGDTAPSDAPLIDAVRPDGGVSADATGPCPSAPCDLLMQCGCATTQHCTLTDAIEVTCEMPGPVDEGRECSSYLECGRATTCAYLGRPSGVCARFCADDRDCTDGPGSRCLTFSVMGVASDVGACSADCDPIANTGCGALSCVVIQTPAGDDATACNSPGVRVEGQACSLPAQCAAGMSCVGGECVHLCTSDGDCSGAAMCISGAAMIRSRSLGYCGG